MNRQFGALRGLAAMLVVLNHSIHMVLTMPPLWGYGIVDGWVRDVLLAIEQLGLFAVPTFLFISGCFAVYSSRASDKKLNWQPVRAGLKYVLVPYFIWSVAFYILLYVGHGERYNLLSYAKYLLVGYPYNYIPLFLVYYLLSPILVMVARRHSALLLAVIAIYQALLLAVLNPGIFGFILPAWMHAFVPPVVAATIATWAIYYPLGLVYGLQPKVWLPRLERIRWGLVALMVGFFCISVLNYVGALHAPAAQYICPLGFALLIPTLKRNSIPLARPLEEVGKRAYFLYLANLIVIDLVLLIIRSVAPGLLGPPVVLLQPVLFALALLLPLLLIRSVERLPVRSGTRYVFG